MLVVHGGCGHDSSLHRTTVKQHHFTQVRSPLPRLTLYIVGEHARGCGELAQVVLLGAVGAHENRQGSSGGLKLRYRLHKVGKCIFT